MALTRAVVIHGLGGRHADNWFPWLQSRLNIQGIETVVPDFPAPELPQLEAWLAHFGALDLNPDDQLALIGHSLGCNLIYFLLEQWARSGREIGLALCVAPVHEDDALPATRDFFRRLPDFDLVRRGAVRRVIVHSDNDPYISVSHARILAERTEAELEIIPGGGHFNTRAGYDRFDALLKYF